MQNNDEVLQRAIERCRERQILIPTFAQMQNAVEVLIDSIEDPYVRNFLIRNFELGGSIKATHSEAAAEYEMETREIAKAAKRRLENLEHQYGELVESVLPDWFKSKGGQ